MINSAESSDVSRPTIEVEELIERCLGKIEFAQRVLSKLQTYFGDGLAELEEEIRAQNVEGAAKVAHRLKGAAANAAAPSLQTHASEIEKIARSGDLNNIDPHLTQLHQEWDRLNVEIENLDMETFVTCTE